MDEPQKEENPKKGKPGLGARIMRGLRAQVQGQRETLLRAMEGKKEDKEAMDARTRAFIAGGARPKEGRGKKLEHDYQRIPKGARDVLDWDWTPSSGSAGEQEKKQGDKKPEIKKSQQPLGTGLPVEETEQERKEREQLEHDQRIRDFAGSFQQALREEWAGFKQEKKEQTKPRDSKPMVPEESFQKYLQPTKVPTPNEGTMEDKLPMIVSEKQQSTRPMQQPQPEKRGSFSSQEYETPPGEGPRGRETRNRPGNGSYIGGRGRYSGVDRRSRYQVAREYNEAPAWREIERQREELQHMKNLQAGFHAQFRDYMESIQRGGSNDRRGP